MFCGYRIFNECKSLAILYIKYSLSYHLTIYKSFVMKVIEIKKTEKIPEITLDGAKKIFEIKGKCLPENIRNLNELVTKKLESYLNDCLEKKDSAPEKNTLKVNFKLDYFNSAAAKFIADILMLMNNFIEKGCKIKLYWYFHEGDDDMLEAGEDFAEMIDVPIQFIMIPAQDI